MINFSFKKNSWRKRLNNTIDVSYYEKFNNALLNLELNLQEERIKAPFKR